MRARCSICHTLIRPEDATSTCPECTQEYHASCWEELGGCASYGCGEAVSAVKAPPVPNVGSGWGDVKACPVCRREIPSSILDCRCGARFPYADPMTGATYREWVDGERRRKGARTALVLLFIFSMLGFPAPILGPIAGIVAYRNRLRLGGAGGTFLAMGYGSAALGATYTLFIVLLAMGL